MNKLSFIGILLFVNMLLFGQASADTTANNATTIHPEAIQILNNSKGVTYLKDNVLLDSRSLESVLKQNDKAHDEYRIYKTNTGIATALTFVGAGLIAWNVVSYTQYQKDNTSLTNKKSFNATPLWIGLGALAVSIPLAIISKGHIRKAVGIYNDSVNSKTSFNLRLDAGITPNGLGLLITL